MRAALRRLIARVRALVRGADLDRDFDDEMKAHLDMATDDNIRSGMAPDEARRRAILRFGGVTAMAARHREVRGSTVAESLVQDLRFAVRLAVKDRSFSLTVAGILALGIGANTLGYTIVDAAFTRGLPFDKSSELHMVSWINERGRRVGASPRQLDEWRSRSRAFAELAGYVDTTATLSDQYGMADEVRVTRLTANTFALLRQPAIIGRDLISSDAAHDAEPVVVLGHHLWKSRYGGDPKILGEDIHIDGSIVTVIGVMPDGMRFPDQADAWVPLRETAAEMTRGGPRMEVIGRLHDRSSKRIAQAEFDAIARLQKSADPERLKDIVGARVETVPENTIGGTGRELFRLIMAVVMFVLLIAGANVANLLLLRSSARAREMALRTTMGATRWRLVRQLLLESLVLSVAGAAIGLLLAEGAVRLFTIAMANAGLPYWVVFSIDYTGFAYAAALAVVMAIAFGMGPALHLSRANSHEVMKDGGRGQATSRRVTRWAAVMVVVELATAVAFLGGSALLLRSFATLYAVDLGVNIDPLVTMRIKLPPSRYATADDRRRFVDTLESRLAAIPGVQSASITTGVPSRDSGERYIELDGGGLGEPAMVSTVVVSPSYFGTIDVRLRQGHTFGAGDGAPGSETAIINARLAEQFLPGQNPIGRRLRFTVKQPSPTDTPDAWKTIIGVAPDVSHGSPSDGYVNAAVYVPYRETAPASPSILIRTALRPESIMNAVRAEVQALDAQVPVVELATVADILAGDRWIYRTFGSMLAVFAIIATLLSSAALYAALAHAVERRTPEFGVRLALGAHPRTITWLVLRRSLIQLAAGIAIGLGGAVTLGRLLSGLLVGVSPTDPSTLTAISAFLAVVSIAACVRPVRRAARLDPMMSLRVE